MSTKATSSADTLQDDLDKAIADYNTVHHKADVLFGQLADAAAGRHRAMEDLTEARAALEECRRDLAEARATTATLTEELDRALTRAEARKP